MTSLGPSADPYDCISGIVFRDRIFRRRARGGGEEGGGKKRRVRKKRCWDDVASKLTRGKVSHSAFSTVGHTRTRYKTRVMGQECVPKYARVEYEKFINRHTKLQGGYMFASSSRKIYTTEKQKKK